MTSLYLQSFPTRRSSDLLYDYHFFLFALFVIASGLAFLETSANPLIVAMGNPDTAERRLNLAQSFNPLGVISGVLIGKIFILSGVEPTAAELAAMNAAELQAFHTSEARAVQGPYLVLAGVVLIWALMVWLTRFPAVATEKVRSEEHTSELQSRGHLV